MEQCWCWPLGGGGAADGGVAALSPAAAQGAAVVLPEGPAEEPSGEQRGGRA